MTPFHLKIVTPDGLIYDGQAEELIVRTTGGDVAILARHMDYVAPLGMGRAVVVSGNTRRTAACIGGMLSVSGGEVTLVPTTFEWADKIDLERAENAYKRADKVLHDEPWFARALPRKSKFARRKGISLRRDYSVNHAISMISSKCSAEKSPGEYRPDSGRYCL